MKILDATCGTKAMWYEKNHPLVTYLDIRKGNYTWWNNKKAQRDTVKINPTIVGDFTNLQFDDNYFDMVLFDPPHFIRENKESNKLKMIERYGLLLKDGWKQYLKKGIDELFRVLKPSGVFIFKWAETDRSLKDIIGLFPYKPIFGSRHNISKIDKSNIVHWLVFLKYDVNMKLDKIQT